MKLFFSFLSFILCTAMITAQTPATTDNPFYTEFDTPFGTPPFDKIKNEHFMPGFKMGMEMQQKEVHEIAADTLPATFFNTVEKLDRTGDMLGRVSAVFYSLQSANTNDEIQSIANEVTPLLSKHQDDIFLNEQLFARIKAVYENRSATGLNPEQLKLLEDYYAMFVRGGASLSPEKKERFRAINQELSVLQLKFDENVLKETNNFTLVVDKKKDLAGLPKAVVDAAAEAADAAGMKGKWLFTVKKPSMLPFLQYAKNRTLREKLYKAYYNRGDNNNEYDNKINAATIAALRVERANLL